MATRLPGTLKFKPKPGKAKAAAPGGGGVQAPTPTISQTSGTAGSKSGTAASSMPPPSSVPRRQSVSQASTLVPSPVVASQPLDSQATSVDYVPLTLSTGTMSSPEKRPGPEDAGPSTPPLTQTTLLSQSSTLVGGSSQDSTGGKVPASPRQAAPARPRAASPALSTTSVASARSTTSSRAPYSRPGGGKALLVAAAQSREDPLDLPARVHRGGSRARSRAASATPSRASEAPPDLTNGLLPQEADRVPEGPQASFAAQSNIDSGGAGIAVPPTPVAEPDGEPPAFAMAHSSSLEEADMSGLGPPAFSTAAAPSPLPQLSSGSGDGSNGDGVAASASAGAAGEKRKRGRPRKDAVPAGEGAEAGDGADGDADAVTHAGTTTQPRKRVRRAKETWANRNVYRTEVVVSEPRDDEPTASVAGDEHPGEANGREMSATPAPSVTASSRSRTKRSSKRRRSPRITMARANLELAEPGDMIGDEVDEASATMRELVTSRAAEGRISTRGRNLDRIVRERLRATAETGRLGSDDKWRARQPLRRKMRAARNAERATRRQEARESGGNPDEEVSADEEDSEIDYEIEPERLTPESSPEPGQEFVDQRGYNQEQPEIEYDEDGNPIYPEDGVGYDENGEPIVYEYEDQGAADENGDSLEEGADGQVDGEAYADEAGAAEVDPAAAEDDEYGFSRYGFSLTNDDAGRRGGEHGGEDDDDDDDDIDIEHHDDDEAYNAFDAVAQLEERRRRRLDYNPDEVIEEDQEGVMINNASHGKRRPRERWTKDETEFFYAVLSETGENYGLMAHYFPRRTIDQVKRKALKENKANPHRVTEAILNRKRLDPEYLRATVGYSAEKSPERVVAFMAEVTDDFDRVKKSASEMVAEGTNGDQGLGEDYEGGEGADRVGDVGAEGEIVEYEYEDGAEEYEPGAEEEYEYQEGEEDGEFAEEAGAEAA